MVGRRARRRGQRQGSAVWAANRLASAIGHEAVRSSRVVRRWSKPGGWLKMPVMGARVQPAND